MAKKTENIVFQGTGRRKESIARVRVMAGKGEVTVNGKKLDEYFGSDILKVIVNQPFAVTNTVGKYDVVVKVVGGGLTGQAGAIRHGIARALLTVDDAKSQLKLYNLILQEGLSVRRVEELSKEIKDSLERGDKPVIGKKKKTAVSTNDDYDFFRKELENYFPTKVSFSRSSDGKGSITLKFNNDDELQKLVQLFEKLK